MKLYIEHNKRFEVLDDTSLFTVCPECGRLHRVSINELMDIAQSSALKADPCDEDYEFVYLDNLEIYCTDCSARHNGYHDRA